MLEKFYLSKRDRRPSHFGNSPNAQTTALHGGKIVFKRKAVGRESNVPEWTSDYEPPNLSHIQMSTEQLNTVQEEYDQHQQTNDFVINQELLNEQDVPNGSGRATPQKRKPRKKTTLTAREAAEIFLLKHPRASDPNSFGAGDSVVISKRFGISPKAVRDIWNRCAPSTGYIPVTVLAAQNFGSMKKCR